MEPAQDPSEPFDLVDRDGRPLDRTKPRALVHRDGDWHRSLHIWVWARVDGEAALIFQRRSARKDTHPSKLDVAVTGHLRAGESVTDALREAEEEIGVSLGPSDIVRIGLRRRADTSKPGLVDNEVQDIFCTLSPVDVRALRPSPAEVEGLVALPLSAAQKVLGEGVEAQGIELPSGAHRSIHARDLVPAHDGYYARALASVEAVIAGASPAPWQLG